MRHCTMLIFSRHISVKLLIDNLQFLGRKCTSVLVGAAERPILEKLLSPNIRTDQCKMVPGQADVASNFLLQRSQCAFSRRRRSLDIDNHWPLLARQQVVALIPRGAP